MDEISQRRKRIKERMYDKFHRGFVNTCMGITAVASLYLGYKVYQYYRYIRPLQTAREKLAEDELLLEGRSLEDSSNIELST